MFRQAPAIIRTSSGQLFQVRETGDADLSHVWLGREVKPSRVGFVFKAKSREMLVRKAGAIIFVPAGTV